MNKEQKEKQRKLKETELRKLKTELNNVITSNLEKYKIDYNCLLVSRYSYMLEDDYKELFIKLQEHIKLIKKINKRC